MRLAEISVSMLAWLVLATPAWAQDAKALEGKFCGQLWSAGETVEAVTILKAENDGKLSGSYAFADGKNDTSGTLMETSVGSGLSRTFVWQDIYGSGNLVVKFDANLNGFKGLWGPNWQKPQAQWDGARCNRAISRTDRQPQTYEASEMLNANRLHNENSPVIVNF